MIFRLTSGGMTLSDWEGNRRSIVALAVRYRLRRHKDFPDQATDHRRSCVRGVRHLGIIYFYLYLLGRIACTQSIDAAYCCRCSVVSVCVCLSVEHNRKPHKTAELMEVPFGLKTRVGPRNYVSGGGSDLPGEEAIQYGEISSTSIKES